MGGLDWISQVIDLGKRTYEIAKKTNNLELEEAIMELREAALESRQELLDAKNYADRLEARVKELERNTELIRHLKRSGDFYFAEGDPVPFCSPCIEVKRIPVHVLMTGRIAAARRVWECPNCKTEAMDFDRRAG